MSYVGSNCWRMSSVGVQVNHLNRRQALISTTSQPFLKMPHCFKSPLSWHKPINIDMKEIDLKRSGRVFCQLSSILDWHQMSQVKLSIWEAEFEFSIQASNWLPTEFWGWKNGASVSPQCQKNPKKANGSWKPCFTTVVISHCPQYATEWEFITQP